MILFVLVKVTYCAKHWGHETNPAFPPSYTRKAGEFCKLTLGPGGPGLPGNPR